MIISTMNDLPGYRIDDVLGEVFGLTVRSRNVGSTIGAWGKSLVGGELKGMTKLLAEGRQHATDRLVEEAEGKGANAVIAFRFDTSELGSTWTEICAYGTAVVAVPLTDDAIRQDAAISQLGQAPHQAGYRGPDAPPGASAGPAPMPSGAG